MKLPDEIWQQLLLLIWAILIGFIIPLAFLSLFRRRIGKDVKSMWIKYASWFILVPAITLPMLIGEIAMQIVFLFLSLYAFEEYTRAVGLWKDQGHVWLGRLCIFLVYIPVFTSSWGLFTTMPAYVILGIFIFPIIRDIYKGMIQRSCLTIVGAIYFGWFLAHLAYLVNAPEGKALILAFLLVVVFNDASAYLIGSTVGQHRMVPKLSPNKTWEGAIGATIIAIGVMFAVRFALYDLSILHTLLLGLLVALAGTFGDLTISMIKRDVNIKDTGSIIPGHGGVLDRLDSILFASPIFFHYMNYLFSLVS